MHDTDHSQWRLLPDADDDQDQAAVLREILFIYPEPITLGELTRMMTFASTEFSELDRIERAARELTATGLLHRREDDFLLPTRSAVTFHRLVNL
ncbi:MAG: hypothetical protein ACM3W4_07710 [Ignavibacteriales bacterium]